MLGGSAVLVDPILAELMSKATRVLVLQAAGVSAWTDAEVEFGVFKADDTDGDPSNNYSGSATFYAGSAVDADGHARVFTVSSLAAGAYDFTTGGVPIIVGSLEFEPDQLFLRGTMSAASNDGQVGMPIPVDVLVAALDAAGYGSMGTAIQRQADLDLNGDGTKDAISAAFDFRSVPCFVD